MIFTNRPDGHAGSFRGGAFCLLIYPRLGPWAIFTPPRFPGEELGFVRCSWFVVGCSKVFAPERGRTFIAHGHSIADCGSWIVDWGSPTGSGNHAGPFRGGAHFFVIHPRFGPWAIVFLPGSRAKREDRSWFVVRCSRVRGSAIYLSPITNHQSLFPIPYPLPPPDEALDAFVDLFVEDLPDLSRRAADDLV
jgi:hypothetical protein